MRFCFKWRQSHSHFPICSNSHWKNFDSVAKQTFFSISEWPQHCTWTSSNCFESSANRDFCENHMPIRKHLCFWNQKHQLRLHSRRTFPQLNPKVASTDASPVLYPFYPHFLLQQPQIVDLATCSVAKPRIPVGFLQLTHTKTHHNIVPESAISCAILDVSCWANLASNHRRAALGLT